MSEELAIYNLRNTLPATPEQFIGTFSPAKCFRLFSQVNTPEKALESNAPVLGTIRKTYSEDFLIAYISVWIVNLNDFTNALRKMTPPQMEETAVFIIQEYPFLNVSDINLVFRMIKKGEFGPLFAELDGVKILTWFEKYVKIRMRAAADASIAEADRYKSDMPRVSTREKDTRNQAMLMQLQNRYSVKNE